MPALSPFVVDLAGLVVALEGVQPAWERVLAPRYGAFRTTQPPALRVALVARGAVAGLEALERLRAEVVTVEAGGGRLELRSRSIAASFDLAAGTGTLAAPLDRHGVDALMRALLTIRFEDGLLLHGALVAEGGDAWLCGGPSGAGKSTLAALAGEAALCDELTLLRRSGPGIWNAYALPFWHGRPGGGRLRGVRLLEHAPVHRLVALAPAEACRRLLAEVIWPTFSAPHCERTLELAGRLLEEVEVAALRFRPTPDFRAVLAATVPEAAA